MNALFVALHAVIVVCSFAQLATDGPTDRTNGPTTLNPYACDIEWSRYCMNTYIDRWGFNSSQTMIFPDPDTFNRVASDYIKATGVNGLANAKTWWTALTTCHGPNFYPCVFDPDQLQKIFQTTSTVEDGTLWLITMLEEDYTNNFPAYDVIRQNYHCATQVQAHYEAALTQCQQIYIDDVNKDPVNICNYQVIYMSCLQTIYAANCGNKLGGFFCNEAGIYFFVMNPHCIGNPPTENVCYSMT